NIRSQKTRSRKHIVLSCYITVMFVLSTTIIVSNAIDVRQYIQAIFLGMLPERSFFGLSRIAEPCFVLANWGADGLLIWRCLLIYRSYNGTPRWVVAISCILAFLSIGNAFFNPRITVFMSVWIYCIISLFINLVITTMIIARLNACRRRITKTLGSNHGTLYTNVMAMIIESALLTLFSLIFVVISLLTGGVSSGNLLSLAIQILA
ncbi:hypothetical protein BDQ12DRAFT_571367, partial [Crucibulum laeve]